MSRVFQWGQIDQRLQRAALGIGALGRTAFWGRRGTRRREQPGPAGCWADCLPGF